MSGPFVTIVASPLYINSHSRVVRPGDPPPRGKRTSPPSMPSLNNPPSSPSLPPRPVPRRRTNAWPRWNMHRRPYRPRQQASARPCRPLLDGHDLQALLLPAPLHGHSQGRVPRDQTRPPQRQGRPQELGPPQGPQGLCQAVPDPGRSDGRCRCCGPPLNSRPRTAT